MKNKMNNIALVTPVKDEINNLPRLFDSLESQTMNIYMWLIIENNSVDGSKEYLNENRSLKNVNNLKIFSLKFDSKEYDIGFKYSKIIQYGFDYLKKSDLYKNIDFVGILDSDSFPEPCYFEKLVKNLTRNPSIGITSGVIFYDDEKKENVNYNHIRGSGRLWNKECWEVAGNYYGLSPDSTTRIKATLNGWDPEVTKNAKFYSRKANSRSSLEFKGKSAYYNGFTFTYIVLKSIYYLYKDPKMSYPLLLGYLKYKLKNVERNPDTNVMNYNKRFIYRKFHKKL